VPIKPSFGTKSDLHFVGDLMELMAAHKILAVKLPNGLEIQVSQAAFVPPPPVFAMPPPPVPREPPAEITAPFNAFRPWEKTKAPNVETVRAELTRAVSQYADPTDPESDLDESRLLGDDLPGAN
jgi:hypothetical protein